jgi:hypothetical protein
MRCRDLLIREQGGSVEHLGYAELFVLELKSLPDAMQRLNACDALINANERIDLLAADIALANEAAESVLNSDALKQLLALVLKLGNFINAGTFRANAFGFRIDSLNKMLDTKTADNSGSLLNYYAQLIVQRFPQLTAAVNEFLSLEAASRREFSFLFLMCLMMCSGHVGDAWRLEHDQERSWRLAQIPR